MNNFYRKLKGRGVGAKDWINTFTEVEYLGEGKFGASITPGNRVFFDKIDDNKPKKHKLTDERPTKDYVLFQSAKCCVEIYPYYAKYYDVNHEEVRLYEERWVVQRLFKEPDTWRDVDAYNPVVSVEETDSGITVTVTYDSDYGSLVVKYIQRDGAALKHDVVFTNTSGSTETFRVLQRWSGIVGTKCNGKTTPVVENAPYFAFHSADKTKKIFNISENLRSMVYNPDRTKKTEHCLQLPVSIDTHAQGMKADFIYAQWILAQDESLTIDPDTATLNNPTEDGFVAWDGDLYVRIDETMYYGGYGDDPDWVEDARGYVEWDISSIAGGTLTANPALKYEGGLDLATDGELNPILEEQPSSGGCTDAELYSYIATGVAYVNPFDVVVAPNQSQDLGVAAKSDLQTAMDNSQWFAIGFQSPSDEGAITDKMSSILVEEEAPTPPPTLYVVYTPEPPLTVKYYFNSYEVSGWTNPNNMLDGSTLTFADVEGTDLQACDGNTCPGTNLGTITKVELRFHGYASSIVGEGTIIDLIPGFEGGAGDSHTEILTTSPFWSAYFDITTDPNAPSPWTWADVQDLWCFVNSGGDEVTYYCSKVEIRVTYTEVVKVPKIPRHSGTAGMPHIFGVFLSLRTPLYRRKPRLHHVA